MCQLNGSSRCLIMGAFLFLCGWIVTEGSARAQFPVAGLTSENLKRIYLHRYAPTPEEKSALIERIRVNWPAYRFEMHGENRVTLLNTSSTVLQIGLRAGEWGKDFWVVPGGSYTVAIPNGQFEFCFKRIDLPDRLQICDGGLRIWNQHITITASDSPAAGGGFGR